MDGKMTKKKIKSNQLTNRKQDGQGGKKKKIERNSY